jgi:S-adenosylmethionine:tRNA ribosyltransferase-isomerase
VKLSDFDFYLPSELIAQTPEKLRDHSRLMVVDRQSGKIHHAQFHQLPRYLSHNPLMVFNNTRVLPAKIQGYKKGSKTPVEVLLVRETRPRLWEALVKGLKKIPAGTEFVFGGERLRLEYSGSLSDLLMDIARMPLPPYIRRNAEDNSRQLDRERYQTVYASQPGAIAAPTAGLHFTEELLGKIIEGGTETAYLTLHVGIGTFKPIRDETITGHVMESEHFHVPVDTWNRIYKAKQDSRTLLAVGTTSTRVLESISFDEPTREPISGETNRFIYPGYKFQTVNQLLTNFHLPKSTLFLLTCAFAGTELMKRAYDEAVQRKYRFFSYGDAMLIL